MGIIPIVILDVLLAKTPIAAWHILLVVRTGTDAARVLDLSGMLEVEASRGHSLCGGKLA